MKFWTKRTAAVMAVLYLWLFVNSLGEGEFIAAWLGACVLASLVAYFIKWLYVTAKARPGESQTAQAVD
jgi:ABC-type Fe3+-siderophore transport system permease subunit